MVFSVRNMLWLTFFAVILAAWWVMYAMARDMGLTLWGTMSMPMGDMGSMGGTAMDGGMSDMAGGMDMAGMTRFGPLFAMWAIMMAAMMLPTMVPTLRAYEDLITSANGSRAGWLGVLGGYFIAWVGFAAVLAGAQVTLWSTQIVDGMGMATSLWISAALLLAAGLYQFTPAKEACHGVCHSPMGYFLGHWRTGGAGGLRMGLGLGAYCIGCCWGFMVLGFAGGVMNLLWMFVATLVMILEKVPQIGHYLLRPLGVGLIVMAGWVGGLAAGLW